MSAAGNFTISPMGAARPVQGMVRRLELSCKLFIQCKLIACRTLFSYMRRKVFTLHGIYLLIAAAQIGQ